LIAEDLAYPAPQFHVPVHDFQLPLR
jgi:hypothetical protein